MEHMLVTLNEQQRVACVAEPVGGLQILAGPGSGKTKTLTSRVAFLLDHYGLEPSEMILVTFTNKSAREMKERLEKLVGEEVIGRLLMGTFHSVCVRLLRRYGGLIHLSPNFVISDMADCLALLKRIVGSRPPKPGAPSDKKPDPKVYQSAISNAKSRQIPAHGYRNAMYATATEAERQQFVFSWEETEAIYIEYEENLEREGAVDFDDLLLLGYKLVKRHPHVVKHVKAVLIDEFQDTSVLQYELVRELSRANKCLCVVGDPDQSIYGWRNAEAENLNRMLNDFKPCAVVKLEINYRSTGSIIAAALAVVRQDKKRVDKSLKAHHPVGSAVRSMKFMNGPAEFAFIAREIKRLRASFGNALEWKHFAILLRYNALSRGIEQALQAEGIPSRMVGGLKFFDRAEVKDILAYLQVIDNPSFTVAVERIIAVPKRGVAEKTMEKIVAASRKMKKNPGQGFFTSSKTVKALPGAAATDDLVDEDGTDVRTGARARSVTPQPSDEVGITAFDALVRVANGHPVDGVTLTAPMKTGIREFVATIRELRSLAEKGTSVSDLIDIIVERINYKDFLERTKGPDWKDRMENIVELKAFASTLLSGSEGVETSLPALDTDNAAGPTTPLREFLARAMLASDSQAEHSSDPEGEDLNRVVISTCHSAKGLEWPVVFIPCCEAGNYPFYRADTEDAKDEERRLLYVAITRAQSFCYTTSAAMRMRGSDNKAQVDSPYVVEAKGVSPEVWSDKAVKVNEAQRVQACSIIGIAPPAEAAVTEAQAKVKLEEARWEQADADAQARANNNRALNRSASGGSWASSSQGSSQGRKNNYGSGGGFQRPQVPPQQQQQQQQQQGPRPVPAYQKNAAFQTARAALANGSYISSSAPAAASKLSQGTTQWNTKSNAASSSFGSSSAQPGQFSRPAAMAAPTKSAPLPTAATGAAAPTGQPMALPETRQSMIKDSVLLNPDNVPAGVKPSLEGFQSQEAKDLANMKSILNTKDGNNTSSAAAGSSSFLNFNSKPVIAEPKPAAAKGKGKGKAAAAPKPPAAKKVAPAKRAAPTSEATVEDDGAAQGRSKRVRKKTERAIEADLI